MVELRRHGVVLHGHEQGVEDDADGDGQVHKGVHHHKVDPVLGRHPELAAVPLQEEVGEAVPAGGTGSLGLLQL